ncbi:MAG: response regulator [Desulfobacteraceae bacterium]|nr:response regulator [Desulfobacteraceae bacterium]
MRKCTGNNTQEWGADAIFDVKCKNCGELVEFFKDEITKNCFHCKKKFIITGKIMDAPNGVHLYHHILKTFVLNLKGQKTDFIGRLLLVKDIEFVYVDNATNALELIESTDSAFSLIISDQRMPGMQGTDFLEQVKSISPDSVRFLLTAYSDMDTIIDSVNSGSVHNTLISPGMMRVCGNPFKNAINQFESVLEDERLLKNSEKSKYKAF